MTNTTKPAKRTIRTTVRGSVNGYVGREFVECFGERSDPAAMERANAWLAGTE